MSSNKPILLGYKTPTFKHVTYHVGTSVPGKKHSSGEWWKCSSKQCTEWAQNGAVGGDQSGVGGYQRSAAGSEAAYNGRDAPMVEQEKES